jgi:hypothetical protein
MQPIRFHPAYGNPNINLKPFLHKSGIIELPLSCTKIFGIRIPCSGGSYFRFYPYFLFSFLFKKCNKQGRSGVFYIHPWEIGNLSNTFEVKGLQKLRKYYNSDKTISRLNKLLYDFKFITINDFLNQLNLKYEY